MWKVIKHTKPYLLLIFLSIGILFGQANLDLALPDYLSNIVDTGIQNSGVEYAVPVAIRQNEFNRSFIFMSPENQTFILDEYTLVDENSTDYGSYLETYPILENESIYVLNKVNRAKLQEMNDLLAGPLVTVFTLEQALANPENATFIWDALGFNTSMLPPEQVFFDTLWLFSLENRTLINFFVTSYYSALGETMLNQVAILAVRTEYDIIQMDVDKIQRNFILRTGGLMLLMTLLSVLCTITVSYLASRTAAGMARNIRSDLFNKVENFSSIEFDNFSTASLITRSTNDVTQIQMAVVMIVRMVFYAPILGIGGIIRALNKSTDMWWLIGVALLILIVLIGIVVLIAVPKFNRMQSLTDRVNLVAREGLIGMLVVRAFNREKYEEKRFDNVNKDLTGVILFLNRLMVIMMPFMMIVMQGLMLSIIWVGSHQVNDLTMQVGDMMAFMQYAMQIVFAFLMLTMMFIILPRAIVSTRRINEVLVIEPVITDPEDPKVFPVPFKGVVEFKNVTFRYPGAKKDVLHKISFTAQPGQTTAFIGATGSGKSTVINLIPRFYDTSSGSIRIDGIDIKNVTQHDLRDKIGYVPQKSSLFSGTIESNLLFADQNADKESLQSALDIAQATEFVSSSSDGIEREIAQAGANVSGGQKQRLSIARALVKKPQIYVFDDIMSNLDFKTDAALRKALKEKTGESTVLMVTQRVSTIKEAEQIIVIDDGRIVCKGTHDELLKTCDIYNEIAVSQLELEENNIE
ncbi:MAG: ABC transporter ATP-binding protein [Candidatus Heimdallarchaeota archaeon]|nr:ABC transporter ATP-binding protein [Candidatus Heimdallarchaeota archaeon]MBY8995922.1 ABC transporter ATP-binding protein [Candidatus Heimdallarchaeota archaeon]